MKKILVDIKNFIEKPEEQGCRPPRDPVQMHLTYVIAGISVMLAAFITFSTYPYIFTADGGSRLRMAWSLYYGEVSEQTLLTHTQSIFMYLFYSLTNNFSAYTFFQSFFMIFSLSLLIKQLMSGYEYKNTLIKYAWIIVAILLISFPVTLVFSVILTDSSGVIIGLSLGLSLLFTNLKTTKTRLVFYFIAMLFSFTLLFGYRLNSLLLTPIFVVIILFFRNIPKIRRVTESLTLIIAFIFVFNTVPHIVKTGHYQPAALSFAWEIVGIAKETGADKYKHILDFAGDTQKAIERYETDRLNPIFWENNPPLPALTVARPDISTEISKQYIKAILRSPKAFLKVKMNTALLVSGIKKPLLEIGRGIHDVDENTTKFGGINTDQNISVRKVYTNWSDSFEWLTLRPYILFSLSTILLLVVFKLNRKQFSKWFFLYLCSVVYYFGFFLNTQAMEFRYYAPSFFMLTVLTLSSAIIIFDKFIFILRTKRSKL